MDTANHVAMRRGTAADSDARCALFSRVTMDADLVLSVDRSPDFDALYRLHGGSFTCWVGESDGQLAGMGTVVARPGYIHGRPATVGYLGDLRIAPGLQGRGLLGRFYGPALRTAADDTGAQVFLTALIASNARAVEALTGPKAAARGVPPYTLVRRFSIRAVHATVARRPRRTGYAVRQATPGDVPALAAFLDDDGRARPYGYALTGAELRRRLSTWPGLAIGDFLLACDRGGNLVGCLAAWDASPVKRTVVAAYRRRMRIVRRAYDTAAVLLRFPRLPAPGGTLAYRYVTHQAVPSGDPAIMAALLDVAYADLRAGGQALLCACVWEGDPLAPAYRGFATSDLAAHLYAVTLPGAPAPPACPPGVPPGFEMALV